MKTSKSEAKRKLTPLGYFISIGGMLLGLFSYLSLGVDRFFLGLRGVLGLSDIVWAIIGGIIWIHVIMVIPCFILLKLGIGMKDD